MNFQQVLIDLRQAYEGLSPNLAEAAANDFYNSFEYGHLREFTGDLSFMAIRKNSFRLLNEMVDCCDDRLAGAAINIAALSVVLESHITNGAIFGEDQYTWCSIRAFASMDRLPRENPHVNVLLQAVSDLEMHL